MKSSFVFVSKTIFITACLLAFFACVSAFGVAYAYFAGQYSVEKEYNVATMSSKAYTSVLSGNNVSISNEYVSNTTISPGASLTLTIKNTSQVDKVLLRVAYGVKVGTTDTNTTDYAINLIDSAVYTKVNTTQDNAGFTILENGWFYYNATLQQNEFAPFATFSNTGSGAIHIQLNIEVVQASLDVAQNYWNYHSGYSKETIGDPDSVDGIDMTGNNQNAINGISVFIPDNQNWKAATSANSLDAPFVLGQNTTTISTLTGDGTNDCMRVYNNSGNPIILALRVYVQLVAQNSQWANPTGDFYNTSVRLNFTNNSNWIDIRDNATAFTFDSTSSAHYVAFLYNQLVMPGESVLGLTNLVNIINAPASISETYSFHFVCEVLGYNASESSWVDNYLAMGDGTNPEGSGSINIGINRVPLYYNYTTTNASSPVYSSQLVDGKYTNRAQFYSKYAIWYNIISGSLS